jgi:hypothetical protein
MRSIKDLQPKYHRGGYLHEHPHEWREQIGDVSRAIGSGLSSIGRDIQDVAAASILGEFFGIEPSQQFSEPSAPSPRRVPDILGPDYPDDSAGLPSTWDALGMFSGFGDVVDVGAGLSNIFEGVLEGEPMEGVKAGLPLLLLTWAPFGADKYLLGKWFKEGKKNMTTKELQEVPNAMYRASEKFIQNAPKEQVEEAVSEMTRLVRAFDEPYFAAEQAKQEAAILAGDIYHVNMEGPMYHNSEALRYTSRAMDAAESNRLKLLRKDLEEEWMANYRKEHPLLSKDVTFEDLMQSPSVLSSGEMVYPSLKEASDFIKRGIQKFHHDERMLFKPHNSADLRGYEAMEGTPTIAAKQAAVHHANADYKEAADMITGSQGMQRYIEGGDLYRIGSKDRPVRVYNRSGIDAVDWKNIESGDIITLDQPEVFRGVPDDGTQRLVSTSMDDYLRASSQAERPYFKIVDTEGLPASRPSSYGGGYYGEREISLHPNQTYEVVAVGSVAPGTPYQVGTQQVVRDGIEYTLRPLPNDYAKGGKFRIKKDKKKGCRCRHNRK